MVMLRFCSKEKLSISLAMMSISLYDFFTCLLIYFITSTGIFNWLSENNFIRYVFNYISSGNSNENILADSNLLLKSNVFIFKSVIEV